MEETKLQRILMELRTDLDMLLERYYSGATKEMQEKLSSLSTLVTELQTKVETLDSDNTTNKTDIESIKADIVNIKSKCEEFTTNIANLQSSVTQNTSDITDLTTRVTTAETDIDDLQTLTASHTETLNDHWDKMTLLLAEAISMTTKMSNAEERITALENSSATGNPEISKADITALQTQVDALETEVDSLTTKVTTNTTNIADLTSKVNTNTTNIATNTADITLLKTTTENITSTVSELQTTVANNTQNISNLQSTISTNTTNIQTNTDNISALQSQVNTNTENIATTTANIATNTANIATNTTNIATLMAFRDSLLTPADPYYNPKTFSDYPAGTILQGYAKYSRKFNKAYASTGTFTSPNIVFSAENGSSGKLLFKMKFSSNNTFSGMLKIYLNDASIYEEAIDFLDSSLTYTIEKEISGLTLSDGNVFYAKITPNFLRSFTLQNLEAELIAPNAEVINQLSPFFVEYYNNKYYLSDCSSGTAKIAEISVDEIHNINNIVWEDTGIECLQYRFSFIVKSYGENYQVVKRVDFYCSPNDENIITFIDKENDSTICTSNCSQLDWSMAKSANVFYAGLQENESVLATLYNSNLSYSKRLQGTFYETAAAKRFEGVDSLDHRSYCISVKSNGHCYPAAIHYLYTDTMDLGFGTRNHLYCNNQNPNLVYLTCYSKFYDKIIKKCYTYVNANTYELTSTESIGAYEEYFEGINNDYFVVKNNKLEYHKKP